MLPTGVRSRLPSWLKIAFTAWLALWVPVYWVYNGPQNFLWLCDVANFVLGAAIWLESSLLFSSQAAGVLLIQILWSVDFLGRLLFGFHLIGGTEYMFDAGRHVALRAFSLFHLATPPLLLWGICRLGYDRRGWLLQTAFTGALLPATYLLAEPERNINWLWQPFGVTLPWAPSWGWVLACMVIYPLLVYLPSHLALSWWVRRKGR